MISVFQYSKEMGHIFVPKAEKLLDRSILLQDKEFVRLVDEMGGDARIADRASLLRRRHVDQSDQTDLL